jgi:hypothetical protein
LYKKADLINELARVTATKKEAAMTVEISLNLIKRTIKRKRIFTSLVLALSRQSKGKQEKAVIPRLQKQTGLQLK